MGGALNSSFFKYIIPSFLGFFLLSAFNPYYGSLSSSIKNNLIFIVTKPSVHFYQPGCIGIFEEREESTFETIETKPKLNNSDNENYFRCGSNHNCLHIESVIDYSYLYIYKFNTFFYLLPYLPNPPPIA